MVNERRKERAAERWLFFFFALLKEGGVKNSEIEMINFEEAFY